MTGFVLNITGVVLDITGFALNMTQFVLYVNEFVLNMIGLLLNMTGFVLNMRVLQTYQGTLSPAAWQLSRKETTAHHFSRTGDRYCHILTDSVSLVL